MALRFCFPLIASALALVNVADASIVLDQNFISATAPNGYATLTTADGSLGRAQTFTVGVAGKLDSVEVHLIDGFGYEMRILQTSGGTPIGGASGSSVLASTTTLTPLSGDIYRYDFSGANLQVEVGDVLAIELLKDADINGNFFASWRFNNNESYTRGASFFFNTGASINDWTLTSHDYRFRTYVNVSSVPEPSTFILFSIGCCCLCGYRMRRTGRRTRGSD